MESKKVISNTIKLIFGFSLAFSARGSEGNPSSQFNYLNANSEILTIVASPLEVDPAYSLQDKDSSKDGITVGRSDRLGGRVSLIPVESYTELNPQDLKYFKFSGGRFIIESALEQFNTLNYEGMGIIMIKKVADSTCVGWFLQQGYEYDLAEGEYYYTSIDRGHVSNGTEALMSVIGIETCYVNTDQGNLEVNLSFDVEQ